MSQSCPKVVLVLLCFLSLLVIRKCSCKQTMSENKSTVFVKSILLWLNPVVLKLVTHICESIVVLSIILYFVLHQQHYPKLEFSGLLYSCTMVTEICYLPLLIQQLHYLPHHVVVPYVHLLFAVVLSFWDNRPTL